MKIWRGWTTPETGKGREGRPSNFWEKQIYPGQMEYVAINIENWNSLIKQIDRQDIFKNIENKVNK